MKSLLFTSRKQNNHHSSGSSQKFFERGVPSHQVGRIRHLCDVQLRFLPHQVITPDQHAKIESSRHHQLINTVNVVPKFNAKRLAQHLKSAQHCHAQGNSEQVVSPGQPK